MATPSNVSDREIPQKGILYLFRKNQGNVPFIFSSPFCCYELPFLGIISGRGKAGNLHCYRYQVEEGDLTLVLSVKRDHRWAKEWSLVCDCSFTHVFRVLQRNKHRYEAWVGTSPCLYQIWRHMCYRLAVPLEVELPVIFILRIKRCTWLLRVSRRTWVFQSFCKVKKYTLLFLLRKLQDLHLLVTIWSEGRLVTARLWFILFCKNFCLRWI